MEQNDTISDSKEKGISRFIKKKTIIGLIIVIVIVVAFILIMVFYQSPFEKAYHQASQITVGNTTGGDDYFVIDTNSMDIPSDKPVEEYTEQELVQAMLFPDEQEKALKAIKATNETLGFNGSLYSKMLETTALMGRQTEESGKYKVSWTYHPDSGLEVTYEKK